jgi:hypothetical protein
MRISHDIRKNSLENEKSEEALIEFGMKEKSEEFIKNGSKIYR